MKPGLSRFAALAAASVLALGGCEDGAVNDDSNFFVLTFRTSVDAGGTQGNGPSTRPMISADGRFIAFQSRATNFVPDDTNGRIDIFRKEVSSNTVVRVSVEGPAGDVEVDGDNANADSENPRITPDGRYIVYESMADDMVPGDNQSTLDIFRRDMETGTTIRISVDTAGATANGHSRNAAISDDGRYVAFESLATNLVANDTNVVSDIFVRDTLFNVTTRVSVSTAGVQGLSSSRNPDISGDGLVVVYESDSNNLVTGDTNAVVGPPVVIGTDIFARYWQSVAATTTRVSVEGPGNIDGNTLDLDNANGNSQNPRVSRDGRYVTFLSSASDIVANDSNGRVDAFVRDRGLSTTTRASSSSVGTEGSQDCFGASISGDGRWVAFGTTAPDLVGNDTNNASDIFLRDLVLGTTIRVSVATYGIESQPFFDSFNPSLTSDGRFVTFNSSAPNLAPNDSNGTFDIFVRGPLY
jgi:Tol biopolymer transport system component